MENITKKCFLYCGDVGILEILTSNISLQTNSRFAKDFFKEPMYCTRLLGRSKTLMKELTIR